MTVTKDQVLEKLRRVKGPDLDGTSSTSGSFPKF